MGDINIPIEPGHEIEVNGRRYEAVAFRCPENGDQWLNQIGDSAKRGGFREPRLIIRQVPIRRVPTDQDACVWPRRKCWVRDGEDRPWSDDGAYFLLGVRQADHPFLVFNMHGNTAGYRYCEIEVEESDHNVVGHQKSEGKT